MTFGNAFVRAVFCAFTAVMPAADAIACRYNAPPSSRIARANVDAVATARVLGARYTGERGPDLRPWTGSARVERVLRGRVGTAAFDLGRTGSTAACDDGVPPPSRGDLWVLYLRTRTGKPELVLSYPIAVALRDAPRVAKLLADAPRRRPR